MQRRETHDDASRFQENMLFRCASVMPAICELVNAPVWLGVRPPIAVTVRALIWSVVIATISFVVKFVASAAVNPWIASVVMAANCAVERADKKALPSADISADVRSGTVWGVKATS